MLFKVSWFQMFFLFYLLFSFILSFLFLFFRLFSSITFIFLILLWSLFCKYKTISQKDTHPLKLLSFIRKISNNLKYTVFWCVFCEIRRYNWINVWYIKYTVPCTRDQDRCIGKFTAYFKIMRERKKFLVKCR